MKPIPDSLSFHYFCQKLPTAPASSISTHTGIVQVAPESKALAPKVPGHQMGCQLLIATAHMTTPNLRIAAEGYY